VKDLEPIQQWGILFVLLSIMVFIVNVYTSISHLIWATGFICGFILITYKILWPDILKAMEKAMEIDTEIAKDVSEMIREGDIKAGLEKVGESFSFLKGMSIKTTEDVTKLLKYTKRDSTYLLYFIVILHVVGWIGSLFGWMFIWGRLVIFWVGTGRITYGILNGPIYFFGIPIVFPFHGTFGLLIGSWLLYIAWSCLPMLVRRWDKCSGIHYIKGHEGRIIGRFHRNPYSMTGLRMISDDISLIICFPAECLNSNEDRLKRLWKTFRGIWPFYLDLDQLRIDKYIIVAHRDTIEEKDDYTNDDNHLKDQLVDSGHYFINGPTVYKVFLSGFGVKA